MSEITYNLLVVDDDERIRNLLSQYLIKEGFIVSTASGAEEARKKIQLIKFDLIILDIMMPGDDGLTLTKEIRNNSDIPIILLTAKSGMDSKIEGLEIGADDYLTKPFDTEVLLAKIKAIMNRKKIFNVPSSEDIIFKIGKFHFNSKLRILSLEKNQFKLSPKENELLRLLIINVDDLLSREIALNKIWRDDSYFASRSMDVYIAKLRKYLSLDTNIEIINIHGEGFRLVVND